MNKKQKLLTIAALAVFSVIIALHYVWLPAYIDTHLEWLHAWYQDPGDGFWKSIPGHFGRIPPLIQDVRMPLSVLAVFYPGLFFILGGKDPEKKLQPQVSPKGVVALPKYNPARYDAPPVRPNKRLAP